MKLRVLVCGGRDFYDRRKAFYALDTLESSDGIAVIIEGGASGADSLGGFWAESKKIPLLVFKADWHGLGRAAGPIRNKKMIVEGKPDLVLAFPGGAGTRNMVTQARNANIEVRLVV